MEIQTYVVWERISTPSCWTTYFVNFPIFHICHYPRIASCTTCSCWRLFYSFQEIHNRLCHCGYYFMRILHFLHDQAIMFSTSPIFITSCEATTIHIYWYLLNQVKNIELLFLFSVLSHENGDEWLFFLTKDLSTRPSYMVFSWFLVDLHGRDFMVVQTREK